jgi:hypothetical protein
LVRELRKLDVLLEVVFGETGPIKNSLESEGVRTHVVTSLRSNIHPFQDFLSYKKLSRIVASYKPDIVHCHSSKAGLISRLVCWRLKIPVVYSVHGWGFGPGRSRLISLFVYLTEKFLVKYTTKFIAVSEEDRRVGISKIGIMPCSIIRVYNGISYVASSFGSRPKQANLIMVARNDPPKDYQTFFKALGMAKFDKAIVVGRGTDDPDFINKARVLAQSNFIKIEFLG